MIKDAEIKSKFEYLQGVFGKILHDVRREIKQEHLKQDRAFNLKHFGKSQVDKIDSTALEEAYYKELAVDGNQSLSEWIISKWILRHAEVYEFFVKELTEINPNFEEITLLDLEKAKMIASKAVNSFGVVDTLVFSVINSVAFPNEIFEYLKAQALETVASEKKETNKSIEISVEQLQVEHAKELLKLSDRFEKRFQSLSKKYSQVVEGLKKQIGLLQKKLAEVRCS